MIYLDHNATSPLRDEVFEAMRPWLGVPANPASAHRAGQRASVAVELAREQVAALVGMSDPAGVVFTSGATEANHTFLRGLRPEGARRRVLVSAIEHPCVRAAAQELAAGLVAETFGVGPDGVAALPPLEPDMLAVSLMAANHEMGAVQPVSELIASATKAGVAVHVDATQAAGRIPLDLEGAAGVVLSSHKIGGPGGVGALVLSHGEVFPALLTGGRQERDRRAGTVNTAGVVGFGAACALALERLEAQSAHMLGLRRRIEELVRSLGGRVVADVVERLPNTVCAVFPGLRGEGLVQALDLRDVCASAGAACASGSLSESPVLTAMGDPDAGSVLRLSVGPQTTPAEVERFGELLGPVVTAQRALAALEAEWDG